MPKPPWCKTPDGTSIWNAFSFLQKSVRRGREDWAAYWVRQLYFAGQKVWIRLLIIACEDIGLADHSAANHVFTLYRIAKEMPKGQKHKNGRPSNPDLLMVMQATMLLCRCKKSRAVDNAIHWFDLYDGEVPTNDEVKALAESNDPPVPIPDKAYDKHTTDGRKMGRGMEHFLEEKATLTNESDIAPFQPPQEGTKACPRCWGTGRVPA